MTLSNRKERRIVVYDDSVKAVEDGQAYIVARRWKRVHLALLRDDPEGPGRVITATVTMTAPKKSERVEASHV